MNKPENKTKPISLSQNIEDQNIKQKLVFICVVLVVSISTLYWQVLDFDFVNFDDNKYVVENPYVSNGITLDGLIWAFTESYLANWHPVTWLSHMLDFEMYNLDPSGHHLTNLLFHIANALLLFGVLLKMTGAIWRSGLVALLFAIHPLNVESVAWIAERKNVLSTFFWLLTMWVYSDYVKDKKVGNYFLMVFMFFIGLMAKPMLVTLPFVLILFDFWPLKRFGWNKKYTNLDAITPSIKTESFTNLIVEKIPLFLLVVGISVTTYFTQKTGGAMRSTGDSHTLYARVSNALVSYLEYLRKVIFPRELSIYYPHPGNTLPGWKPLACGLVLVALTIWVVKEFRRVPYIAVGWFWYLGTLVPVIGLVQVGEQAMADRYMYIPLIGIFIAFSWGFHELMYRGKQKLIPLGLSAIICMLLFFTWVQVGYWKNSIILFEHSISVTKTRYPSYFVVHYNLGHALANEKRYEEAIASYQNAINFNPVFSGAYVNQGTALAEQGKFNEAITKYNKAIELERDNVDAYFNLGITLNDLSLYEEAIAVYQEILSINPNLFRVHTNFGTLLLNQRNDIDGAINHFQKAIGIEPGYAKAHNNLGATLAKQGRFKESIVHFEKAIAIKPNYIEAQRFLKLARSRAEK